MAVGDKNNPIKLSQLAADEVPAELKVESYFDFQVHPFEHQDLFKGRKSIIDVLGNEIGVYAKSWMSSKISQARDKGNVKSINESRTGGHTMGRFEILLEEGAVFEPAFVWGILDNNTKPHTLCLSKNAIIGGANIFLNEGDIYIGPGSMIEPDASIKGPTLIGEKNEIRSGAYLRGNVILGKAGAGTAFRGELKNVVMMDGANFPHISYLGDSICGYNTHFGNQVTAANLGIFQGLRERSKRTNVVVVIDKKYYDLGIVKMGVILGDNTQIGCSSVIDPGTLLGPNCVAYALTSIERGVYKAGTLFKNKAMARGIVEMGSIDPGRV